LNLISVLEGTAGENAMYDIAVLIYFSCFLE